MLTTLIAASTALLTTQDPDQVSWARLARRLDADGDGRVTRDEFPRRPSLFRRLDRNRDGVLTPADFGEEDSPAATPSVGPADPEGLALFEAEVQPILEASCYDCHAESARRVRGGLKVDSLAAMLQGGVSGPALSPGDPDQSLLVEAVRYHDEDLAMPPDGELAPEEVQAIERWVELGAPWPGETGERDDFLEDLPASTIDIDAGREWWSFQPVEKPEVPTPVDGAWVESDIDAFLLMRLEEAGLEPVGDADKGAWLRRVTFDLTGLPPTPEALEAFVEDTSEGAYANVVDRLLVSPRYAERWGRHWLDVARYAESSGRDSNVMYPHAWRYRDWVIEAFERDLPYDQFLSQQLAGDLLPAEGDDDSAAKVIATGYLAMGPKSHTTRNPLQFAADVADEQIDAISQGMLGLTIACARCHDHKFDPIPTEDYYSLVGILGSTRTLYGTFRSAGNLRDAGLVDLPREADLPNGPAMPMDLRRAYERGLAGLERMSDAPMQMDAEMDSVDRFRMRVAQDNQVRLKDLLGRWDERGNALPENRLAMGVSEGRPRDARVLARGEIDAAGERVPRGFPQVLTDGMTPLINRGSGRRELAAWIAAPENPLTARVWANRIWSHLFGTGLVSSTDNFGKSGQAPSHPELLDWLATTFVEDGWSTKSLVRRVVLSHAYRLSTAGNSENETIDPEVRLLWRMPARRLEAEAMRDAILFAAGTLDLERPTGSPIGFLEGSPRREEVLDVLTEDTRVRSVYMPVLRDRVAHSLECFDAADPSFVTGDREETIVATQALYLMNDEDVMAAADAFARQIVRGGGSDDERITRAFLRALSRKPTASERSAVKRFVRDFGRIVRKDSGSRRPEAAAWSAFAQSLFQSAEFRYRG
jgi:hypothetical protein